MIYTELIICRKDITSIISTYISSCKITIKKYLHFKQAKRIIIIIIILIIISIISYILIVVIVRGIFMYIHLESVLFKEKFN